MTHWVPLLLGLAVAPAEARDLPGELVHAWEQARTDARWRSPYAAERTALREALEQIVAEAATCPADTLTAARGLLGPSDFRLDEIEHEGERVLLIREDAEARGGGLIAVRCGEASPWVVQAPHAFYDLDTRDIAQHLFVEARPRAAMWNTVHRYRATPGEQQADPVHPADVTRQFGSLFHAATVGLAVGDPSLRFVQLHGFGRGGVGAQAIVSTGDPDQPPRALAASLAEVVGHTAAFGHDVHELGGTVNVQGKMLRTWPDGRFLHVELSREQRRRLAADADLREAFVTRLTDGW